MTSPSWGASFFFSQSGRKRHLSLFIQSVNNPNKEGEPIYILDSHILVSLFHNLKKLKTIGVGLVFSCLFYVDFWVRVLALTVSFVSLQVRLCFPVNPGFTSTNPGPSHVGGAARLAAIQTASRIDNGLHRVSPWADSY